MRVALVSALLVLTACRSTAAEARHASRAAQPYLERFERFERWAARTHVAHAELRDRLALEETAFAPIRLERDIVAAWVRMPDDDGRVLALPDGTDLPADANWVAFRDRERGTLRYAESKPCAVDVPRWWRGDLEQGCALVANRPDEHHVGVVMAFKVDG